MNVESTDKRDYIVELDELSERLDQLREQLLQMHVKTPIEDRQATTSSFSESQPDSAPFPNSVTYSGQYQGQAANYHWQPLSYHLDELQTLDTDKTARVLNALGHKQRLDIIRALLILPMTGAELVEHLNMSTTGQLYHHTKALLSSGLLTQEERGGKYKIPDQLVLPLLLLLTGVTELLDTSDYMLMSDVKEQADQ